MRVGRSSMKVEERIVIEESASIVGTKEGAGPLGKLFDRVEKDDSFGCTSWEEAESYLQHRAVQELLQKAGIDAGQISCIFAGDLLGQTIASSYGLSDFQIPMFGIYGACSTCGEALSLAVITLTAGFAERVVCVTSSHFASAEREFRFPLDYGNQRPLSSGWTVTGSGAFLLAKEKTVAEKTGILAYVTGITVGKIVDFGLKDSMNMGGCMAPAAADTIAAHLTDFRRSPQDYDKIITGDLGSVGQSILLDLLLQKGIDIAGQHIDCGMEIFDPDTQDTNAGGSGCGCSASVLSALILRKLSTGEWKRVLFVPTGALLSKTSYNEGKSVPAIAHAVVLESPV